MFATDSDVASSHGCATTDFWLAPVRGSFARVTSCSRAFDMVRVLAVAGQELAEFKWQPSTSSDAVHHIWRRNFEVSPALCYTVFKAIGTTLRSVIVHVPERSLLKGRKTYNLQETLVLLSRTRDLDAVAFLSDPDWDAGDLLRSLKVPEVRRGLAMRSASSNRWPRVLHG
jgi:hypothetical protein